MFMLCYICYVMTVKPLDTAGGETGSGKQEAQDCRSKTIGVIVRTGLRILYKLYDTLHTTSK
jgi:hypothetical protein